MSSELRVDTIKLANGSTATASGLGIGGVGKLGQITETTFTLDQTITSTSYVELNTACRIALTPSASTSKFIFQVQYPYQTNDNNTGFHMIIYKDVGGGGYSSASGLMATHTGHDSSTSKYRTFSGQFLDAPSTTSQITYGFYYTIQHGGGWVIRNSSFTNSNNSDYSVYASTVTAMEVAG